MVKLKFMKDIVIDMNSILIIQINLKIREFNLQELMIQEKEWKYLNFLFIIYTYLIQKVSY